MDILWTQSGLLPECALPIGQTNTRHEQTLDKDWIPLNMAYGLWPTLCLLGKLLTDIGYAQTLDKIWFPLVMAIHTLDTVWTFGKNIGLPIACTLPIGQTLGKY